MKKYIFQIKTLIIYVCCTLLIVSCIKRDRYEYSTIKIDNLIDNYFELSIKDLVVKQIDNNLIEVGLQDDKFWKNKNALTHENQEKLRDKYNDRGLNISFKINHKKGSKPIANRFVWGYGAIWSVNVEFLSLNIYSNKDFDDTHTAWNSLNDIVRFMGVSPLNFIQSQYKTPYIDKGETSDLFRELFANDIISSSTDLYNSYFKTTFGEGSSPFFPIEKMVNDLTHNDLKLIFNHYEGINYMKGRFYLYFTQTPDTPGNYGITLEMVGDNGKTYKTTTIITFE